MKATAADNVTFGFAIAKSGWMNAYDGPPLNGSMMAIEEFNAKGGILGKQIKAVVADTKTDLVEGAKAGAQVIADGAQFMAVSCDYDMGAPAATVANDHKMIAISYCASDAKMGVQGIGPYAFSLEIYGQGEGAVGGGLCLEAGLEAPTRFSTPPPNTTRASATASWNTARSSAARSWASTPSCRKTPRSPRRSPATRTGRASNGEPDVMMRLLLCSGGGHGHPPDPRRRHQCADHGRGFHGRRLLGQERSRLSDHYAVTFGSK